MDRLYLNELFDYYQSLLTQKEKDIFIDHYEEDLSLQEIADNLKVSKAAVGKTLKTVENKLIDYESKLHLQENKKKVNKLLAKNIDKELLNKINEII